MITRERAVARAGKEQPAVVAHLVRDRGEGSWPTWLGVAVRVRGWAERFG